jgi:hypothetical protein
MALPHAASEIRDVDWHRAGFPPGGRGPLSSSDRASKISSIETRWRPPGITLSEGHDVRAAASDAQDAKIDLFSVT